VERMCVLAASYGKESACDDMTVAVVWRPRAGEVVVAAEENTSAVADRPSLVPPSLKPVMFWLLGYKEQGGCDRCMSQRRRLLTLPLLMSS
jgi:hypothetical protein